MVNLFVVPAVLLSLLHQEGNIETSSFLSDAKGPEVLEIKMGMALPYASEWESPKKGNGLLEKNGEFYTLVERNFENDTLYFKYIKNTNAREIFSMLSDKVDNNKDADKQQNSTSNSLLSNWMLLMFKSNTSNDFEYLSFALEESTFPNYSYKNFFPSISQGVDTPPPRLV